MGSRRFSRLLPMPFCLLILFGLGFVSVYGQCLDGQKSILLRLRNTLIFNSSLSTKLRSWDQNQSTDCCRWDGVSCDLGGRVTGLDLSSELISGGIENSDSLFGLQFLQRLNLANNSLNFTAIPSSIGNLTSLTYLNLSVSGFAGQIPFGISLMTNLVTLDLSNAYLSLRSLKLENPSLDALIQNLSKLEELYLGGVNISAMGNGWCRAISDRLPNLRVLSLANCQISGPIDASLANVKSVSVIILSQNNLTGSVPEAFANFPNLTVLRLSSCGLNGVFPQRILQLPTLQVLDLSTNGLLSGSLPDFPESGSLQTLVLSYTKFSGKLPNSIGNLKMLSRIELQNCSFSEHIPNSMANLSQLMYLDLSSNMFVGSIPSFVKSKNLTYLDLSRNNLSGPVPSDYFHGYIALANVDLGFNAFFGGIPLSLFALSSLRNVRLSNNNFDGPLPEFPDPSSFMLDTLDLSSNKLQGPIPKSILSLKMLDILVLSFNNLTGTVSFDEFLRLGNLTNLDLSFNNLSIETIGNNSSSVSVAQFTTLKLASCNLLNFPDLKNQSRLFHLDLSHNRIGGAIPNWIWKIGSGSLNFLNLSSNMLASLQVPYDISSILNVLDLRSNQLSGRIPVVPQSAAYLDYSNNCFSSSLPTDIGNNLTFTYFFSISSNSISGTIPDSICNASYLQVLDLSNNSFSGTIPTCLIDVMSGTLGVFNLGKNNLTGTIPGTFLNNCTLVTLDVHGNGLEGEVPQSLANCTKLEVLNLGNNKLSDGFPCFLKSNSNLRVLVLRSNMLHGGIVCSENVDIWEKIQIIDIASNYFTGHVPENCFLNWKAMTNDEDGAESKLNHLHFEFLQLNRFYYQDTVTVTNKGLDMQLVKILTLFTSIDMSNNSLSGEIPDAVGGLKALYVLNLSHNAFTGSIPPSIGNLTQLESLDLSVNRLSGSIPIELTQLTFLSFLNLSYNQLVGNIPTGTQFQTFTEASFEGNKGLCGPQFNISCGVSLLPDDEALGSVSRKQFDLQFILPGMGFGAGAASVLGLLMFWQQGRNWWQKHTDRLAYAILPRYAICDDFKMEADERAEDEAQDSEDDNWEDGLTGKTFRGRYCVFCTKLDISRKQPIHSLKCTCHNSTPILAVSMSSSSFLESPFAKG